MDEFPRMLYRAGGSEAMHGGLFATCIVQDPDELAAALAAGWYLTTPDAAAGKELDDAPPTREHLLKLAEAQGIKVDGRWSDARLAEMVA